MTLLDIRNKFRAVTFLSFNVELIRVLLMKNIVNVEGWSCDEFSHMVVNCNYDSHDSLSNVNKKCSISINLTPVPGRKRPAFEGFF